MVEFIYVVEFNDIYIKPNLVAISLTTLSTCGVDTNISSICLLCLGLRSLSILGLWLLQQILKIRYTRQVIRALSHVSPRPPKVCFASCESSLLERELDQVFTLQYLIALYTRLFILTKKSILHALIRYIHVIFYVMPKKSYVINATLIFQNFPPYNAYSILQGNQIP